MYDSNSNNSNINSSNSNSNTDNTNHTDNTNRELANYRGCMFQRRSKKTEGWQTVADVHFDAGIRLGDLSCKIAPRGAAEALVLRWCIV